MEKKNLKILMLIFFVALVARICFILTLDNSVDVWGDWWDELGWKLASGQGYWVNNPYFVDGKPFYSWRAPGFPFFLAAIYKIFGHSFLAAKIGLAFVSSLTAIFLFLLTGFLVNNKAAIVCATIYAVYPVAIFWTGYLAPETLTAFFVVVLTFLSVLAVRTDKLLIYFVSGITFGCLFLTRPLAIVLFPVILIYFFIHKKNFLKKVLFFCSGSLIILPWVVRNYLIHHTLVLGSTEGGVVFYIANNERVLGEPSGFYHAENIEEFRGLSEVEIDRKFYRMGFDFVKKNPVLYFNLVIDRFIRFWRFFPHTISGPGEPYSKKHVMISFFIESPLIILGWIGFFLSFRQWRKFFILQGFVVTFSTFTILIRAAIRYRFPVMPLMLVFCIYALWFFKDFRKNHVRKF
ncbi:MAG TPA: glycosyltransferase family 39 protein [bacterium]|nr:glycosyltransferase family 39 protein [bacterium]HOL34692.1 glycosyltransferase family 39 protein [bacterium]HPP07550.1 glycosyltransferase family 39 protein [bacterium]